MRLPPTSAVSALASPGRATERLVARCRTIAALGALVALGFALLIAAASAFDMRALAQLAAGPPPATLTGGICFALLAAALLLLLPPAPSRRRARMGRALAALALLLAGVALVETLADVELGLERVAYLAPAVAAEGVVPGRPSLGSAAATASLAAALLLLDRAKLLGVHPASVLAVLAALLGHVALASHAYGAFAILGDDGDSLARMSLPGSLATLALSCGVVCARARAGFCAALTTAAVGGWVARRFLFVVVGWPILIGVVVLLARRLGVDDAGSTLALIATSTSVIGGVLVVLTANRLNAEDLRRCRMDEQVRASEAKLRAVVHGAGDAIVSFGRDGRIEEWNPAAERIFAIPAQQAIGRRFVELGIASRDGEPALESLRARLRAGERVIDQELAVTTPDGRDVDLLLTATPWVAPDHSVGTCVVAHDLTTRLAAERALARANEVERALRRRQEEWSSIVAHDLRQPIHVIELTAQHLRGAPAGKDAARHLERVLHAARRLDAMIDDLVDVSQLESRRLRIVKRPVDVRSLVEEIVERGCSPSDAERVVVEGDDAPAEVPVDAARLEQVLTNLVANALKYGHAGSAVRVFVRRGDGEVVVSVENRGPGLSADEQRSVFDRFVRATSATKSASPGLGLGLYIARGIVEAHGGRMWVESTPGERTTFSFSLPLQDAAGAVEAAAR